MGDLRGRPLLASPSVPRSVLDISVCLANAWAVATKASSSAV
jgi:hypothetical protein